MDGEMAIPKKAAGPSTLELWRRGVARAITSMRERMADPISLGQLAKTAAMSQFHFDRVFRELTGIPPFQFLSAMRLAAARDMLLTTDTPIADVCFEVGYSSLGTFTRRFTALVGTSPQRLRRLSQDAFEIPQASPPPMSEPHVPDDGLCVHLRGVAPNMLTFVGAFETPLPVGRPKACALSHRSGSLVLSAIPAGTYHVLAAALPANAVSDNDISTNLLVGTALDNPFDIDGTNQRQAVIHLRPLEITDPPIVSFLPLLLREQLRFCNGVRA